MGHYASEMGDGPDYQAEDEREQKRLKVISPMVKRAFLAAVAAWSDPDGAHVWHDTLKLWTKVEDDVKASIALQNNDELFVDREDTRHAFYALVQAGFLEFTMRIKLTDSGKIYLEGLN